STTSPGRRCYRIKIDTSRPGRAADARSHTTGKSHRQPAGTSEPSRARPGEPTHARREGAQRFRSTLRAAQLSTPLFHTVNRYLINSIGLTPEPLSRREKLLYLWRLVPMAEANCNTIELAPRETGKTYIYRNQSYYVTVLSGGKATPASLFINNATGKVGIVGSRDVVVLDEIANTDFTDPKALVSIMQGYMQDPNFSRGKKEILTFASIVLVGNIDIQAKLPHEKYYHLFEPLPDFLQVEAFIDRLHGYVPGWEIRKIHPASLAQDYGFITDYFCEIMHELRRKDV